MNSKTKEEAYNEQILMMKIAPAKESTIKTATLPSKVTPKMRRYRKLKKKIGLNTSEGATKKLTKK